jgi:hypothetical protein
MRLGARVGLALCVGLATFGLAACGSSGSKSNAPAPAGAELTRVSFANHSKYREPVEAVFAGRQCEAFYAQDSFDWVRTRPLWPGAKAEHTRFTLYDRPVRARPVEIEIYGGTRRARVLASPGRIISTVDVDLVDDCLVVDARQDDGSPAKVEYKN